MHGYRGGGRNAKYIKWNKNLLTNECSPRLSRTRDNDDNKKTDNETTSDHYIINSSPPSAAYMRQWIQFLPQDVAFSIHLSDNRFTARPLATTVVSPPRKWAPWVDISTPQSASARFFGKCPLRACALYIPSLNNWQLTDVDGSAVKWIRRTVVEPLLKIYWHSGG